MLHASVGELWSVLFSEVSNNQAAERSGYAKKASEDLEEGPFFKQSSEEKHKSLIIIRILRVNNFHMCKGEKPFSTIHLSFPLAIYIHPSHFHHVAHLQGKKKNGTG